MLFRNMMRKYYEEAGAEGAASGGAGGEPEKTYTAAEVEELTKGMKSKLDELLKEKKSASQAAKDAEAARLAAEQEAARKSGELDKFEASLRGEFEKEKGALTGKLTALESRVLGESKKAVLGGFIGDFIAPESVDLVAQLVNTELDGDQVKNAVYRFRWQRHHDRPGRVQKVDGKTSSNLASHESRCSIRWWGRWW